ncbi:OLC1v1019804C1 [Oldenlandia corymbosa var. corymbosa]|uniref:OLC1v1019804C1 n=1 Tax=Oldenlandia corymbosa var. corymbosa TaxID=529605 RepID=A0AAV1EET8_OLDCO|nr:OLC1v1019804C1 [Oldenlandia corymbosa var. corymbosa]
MATAIAGDCLHACTVQQPRAAINRLHMSFHFAAILSLLYYRISHLLHGDVPILSWSLMTSAELIFTFLWIATQSFRWRPVARSVNLSNLPKNDKLLPGVDVFICTADPKKEPVIEVMNTVVSAMALDYPADKLAVYLSDDGGAGLTLYALKEACSFAKSWVPFCRSYGIKTRSPEAYFASSKDGAHLDWGDELKEEEEKIKMAYDMLKKNVEKLSAIEAYSARQDRPAHVEVIHNDDNNKDEGDDNKQNDLPLLVYVSREKRPTRPHRFKAGALNALLRVSGVMSNAPYILVLDCDMYCNDPLSARQAMCFHLDHQISNTLSYVQFPQIFYNVSKNDIYDGQARSAYKTKYQGMDGLRGTVCSGTGYFMKKKALYCRPDQEDAMVVDLEQNFGSSKAFNDSLKDLNGRRTNSRVEPISESIVEEAKSLATCTFEENTKWGKEVGYSYGSLLESTYTGYLLHCKGWKSVYLYPKRPCFLGCTTIDMKDAMVQLMKWASGLVQVGLSQFSPLTYGVSNMSVLQSMCYAYFTFSHFFSFPCILYGIIPPLCFLRGIPLFPEVSSKWFAPFAVVYLSSLVQHLYEVLSSGGSILTWWNELRIWMIKSVTACLFGCMDALFKKIGVAKANFRLTNKAVDQEKLDKYEKGKFDFQGATMFMIPLTLLVVLNVVCFTIGVKRMISRGNFGEMFGQFALSSHILALSYPILEGLMPKKKEKKKV